MGPDPLVACSEVGYGHFVEQVAGGPDGRTFTGHSEAMRGGKWFSGEGSNDNGCWKRASRRVGIRGEEGDDGLGTRSDGYLASPNRDHQSRTWQLLRLQTHPYALAVREGLLSI